MSEGRTRPGGLIDDRFLIKHQLGGGGAATVWRAQDLVTREDVAIKLLHPRYRGIDEAHERLAREASLLASFTHPHIARARAFEFDRAQPYFVMTLIEGESLEDQLAARSAVDDFFPWTELLRLVQQICSAVDYAHARGVVHRDLKPSNIMLDRQTTPADVRILDFGIAKLLGGVARNPTTQGRVMGTGFYMAPEQARGERLDPRADLFALGVIAFEMTTLRRAWVRSDRGGPIRAFAEAARRNEFNTPSAILSRIAYETRPRPSDFRAALSPAIDAAITWALAIDPADRPPNAGAFYEELVGAVGALEPASDGFSAAVEDRRAARQPRVDPTWSRVSASKSHEMSTLEQSAPTKAGAPPRASGAAGDPRVAPARADEAASLGASSPPDAESDASEGASWNELGTLVADPDDASYPGLAVAEPTRTAVDPADGPPTVAAPSLLAVAAAQQRTRVLMAPTALVAGPTATPSRAAPSLADVPPALKVGVVVVGALTLAALLLLAGYQLGRQRGPLVIETTPGGAGRPSARPRAEDAPTARPADGGDVTPQPSAAPTPPTADTPGAREDEGARRRRGPRRRTAVVAATDDASGAAGRSPTDLQLAPIRRMMKQARANPQDLGLLTRLGRAIEARARDIRNPEERTRVQRIARSSAMLGDADGLGEAVRALTAALSGS